MVYLLLLIHVSNLVRLQFLWINNQNSQGPKQWTKNFLHYFIDNNDNNGTNQLTFCLIIMHATYFFNNQINYTDFMSNLFASQSNNERNLSFALAPDVVIPIFFKSQYIWLHRNHQKEKKATAAVTYCSSILVGVSRTLHKINDIDFINSSLLSQFSYCYACSLSHSFSIFCIAYVVHQCTTLNSNWNSVLAFRPNIYFCTHFRISDIFHQCVIHTHTHTQTHRYAYKSIKEIKFNKKERKINELID